jgi:hypothetical protein
MTTHSRYDKYLSPEEQEKNKNLTDEQFRKLINQTIAVIKWQNTQAEKWGKW